MGNNWLVATSLKINFQGIQYPDWSEQFRVMILPGTWSHAGRQYFF